MIEDIEITLTPEEKTVLSVLQRHKGRKAAIGKEALARACGVTERKCRRIVKALIEIHNVPIGSDYGADGGGYFLAEDPEEMKAVYRRLRRHGISILVRAAAIRGITLQRLMRGIQQELFLMHRPFDIPVVCPECGCRFKLWQGGETDEIRQYLSLMEACRPAPWSLIETYLTCFQGAPNRALKPARLKVLLSDLAKMFRERGFRYDGAFYPCEAATLMEAMKIVVRAGKTGMKNHNYLKVVAMGLAKKEAARAEAALRKREEDIMAGRPLPDDAGAAEAAPEAPLHPMDPETFREMMKELKEKLEKVGGKGREDRGTARRRRTAGQGGRDVQ